MTYLVDAGIEHQIFNWYGTPDIYSEEDLVLLEGIDAQQTYFGGHAGGSIVVSDSYFEKITADIRFLTDSYASTEFNLVAQPEFSFPLTEFTLKLDGDLDFLSGGFDRNYFSEAAINYNFLNVGISPSLVYVDDDLTLSLGVAGYIGLDNENGDSNFYIYPRINASYRLVNELLIAYGGVDGGLHQNTYTSFKDENPFVSPTLYIMPTSRLYEAFGGTNGFSSLNEV